MEAGRQQSTNLQRYLEEFSRRLEEATAGRKSAQQIVDETYEAYPGLGKRWMVKRNVEHFLAQQA